MREKNRAHHRYEPSLELVEGVRLAARALVECTRQRTGAASTLPVDVRALAATLGIPVEISRHLDRWDALLVPTHGGGFRILASERARSRGRVRFSIAHELAHTFLAHTDDDVQHRGSQRVDDPLIERLCDIGAAELLMPWDDVQCFLNGKRPSPGAVLELVERFDVSREAAALRVCDVVEEPLAVAFFDYGIRPSVKDDPARADRPNDLVGAYRVRRAFCRRGFEPYLPVGKSVPPTSVVVRASLTAGEHEGVETIFDKPGSPRLLVRARRVPGSPPDEPPTVCATFQMV